MSISGDIAFTNAVVLTGDNTPAFDATVVVRSGNIIYVGPSCAVESSLIVDVRNRILSPGFIDVHAHSDFSILLYPDAENKIRQGVTTEVIGNCGLSASPLYGAAWERWRNRWARKKLEVDWHEPPEYFERLRSAAPAINLVPLLGHTNLRTAVTGYAGKSLSHTELMQQEKLLSDMLQHGYRGISLGLAYPPGIFADRPELDLIFQCAHRYNVPITVHMRDEGPFVEEALREMIELSCAHNVSLQVSHLKSYGMKNHYKVDTLLHIIESAHTRGIDVHFDRYPYTAFNTDLDIILPQQIFDGGHDRALERLVSDREYLLTHLEQHFDRNDTSRITISQCAKREYVGMTLTEVIGEQQNATLFWQRTLDFFRDIQFDAEANFFLMDEHNLAKIISHPLCMIGSDGSVKLYDEQGLSHPRVYGTFPRFLRMVIDNQLMPLETAVYKITGLPAEKFSLEKRGCIREGYCADLIVWDSEYINDNASYATPCVKPTGISSVWVNGECAMLDGELTSSRAGTVLLKGSE